MDLIDREHLMNYIRLKKINIGKLAHDVIMKQPSIQTQEPKKGHWIYDDKCHEHGHCSECGYGSVDLVDGEPHHYCPKCGAKMESEDNYAT